MNSDNIRRALQFICVVDELKKRIRAGYEIWGVLAQRIESVSEHTLSALFTANALYPLCPWRDKINIDRVNLMLLYHDIGEALIGDIPVIDTAAHDNKAVNEHRAWRKILEILPYEQGIYDLLLEYDACKTYDARFANFCDKFQCNKTVKEYYDAGLFPPLEDCVANSEIIRDNPTIQKLIEEGAKTPIDVWFAEDFIAYSDDDFFMTAHNVLREMDTQQVINDFKNNFQQ